MADINYLNYSIDPFNSDAVSWLNIQTSYYSGSYPNQIVPSSPNFPNALAGTPSRYFMYLPFNIDTTDIINRPISIYDVTGATSLSLVSTTPGVNQVRISSSTLMKNVLEFNAVQAGHEIGIDCYSDGFIVNANRFNNINATSVTSDLYKEKVLQSGVGLSSFEYYKHLAYRIDTVVGINDIDLLDYSAVTSSAFFFKCTLSEQITYDAYYANGSYAPGTSTTDIQFNSFISGAYSTAVAKLQHIQNDRFRLLTAVPFAGGSIWFEAWYY